MGIEETQQVRLRRAATGRRRDARELGVDDVASRSGCQRRSPRSCSTTLGETRSRSAAAARLRGRCLGVSVEPPMR